MCVEHAQSNNIAFVLKRNLHGHAHELSLTQRYTDAHAFATVLIPRQSDSVRREWLTPHALQQSISTAIQDRDEREAL